MKFLTMKEREKQRKKYKEFKKQEINKRFFNFSRLEKHFGIFSLYMILGKKNIGKTTLFINLMKELERKNEFGKILYLRLEDKEAREVRGEWEEDDNYPFFISGNTIYSKKSKNHIENCEDKKICKCKNEIKGKIGFLGSLSQFRGKQFKNYKYILIDEFVNETGSYRNRDTLASQWVKMLSNVTRLKKTGEVKMIMMGNNNSMNNPYLEHFGLSYDTNIFIDEEVPMLFINLRDLYSGSREQKAVMGLAKYSADINLFMKNNADFDNNTKLISGLMKDQYKTSFKFIYGEYGYELKYLQDINENTNFAMEIHNKTKVLYDEGEVYYSVDPLHLIDYNNVKCISKGNWKTIVKSVVSLVKSGNLWFFKAGDKQILQKNYRYMLNSIKNVV